MKRETAKSGTSFESRGHRLVSLLKLTDESAFGMKEWLWLAAIYTVGLCGLVAVMLKRQKDA